MIRSFLGVSIPLLLSSIAVAAESASAKAPAPPTSEVAEDLAPASADARLTAAIPVRYRVADPWLTRATVTAQGGTSSVSAAMPLGDAMANDYAGRVDAAGLSIDLQGRRLGFALALAGGRGESVNAPVDGLDRSALSFGEARVSLGGVLVNSPGVFVSAGPALETRMTAIGSFEPGNEAVASWQTAVVGAELRSRVFVTPRVFFTGAVFAAAIPADGYWQTVDAAGNGGVGSAERGRLAEANVFAGSATASLRPTESLAITGGIAVRSATYEFERKGAGREETIRPFVGLELLY